MAYEITIKRGVGGTDSNHVCIVAWTCLIVLEGTNQGSGYFRNINIYKINFRSLTGFRQCLREAQQYSENAVTDQNLTLQSGTAAIRATTSYTRCSSFRRSAAGPNPFTNAKAISSPTTQPSRSSHCPPYNLPTPDPKFIDKTHEEETKQSKKASRDS